MKKISEKTLNILVIVISLVCTAVICACCIFLAVKSEKKTDVNIMSSPVRTVGVLPDYSITMPFYWHASVLDLSTKNISRGAATFGDSITFSRNDDNLSFLYSTTVFSSGQFYTQTYSVSDRNSSVTTYNEIGLTHFYAQAENGDSPQVSEVAIGYTFFYRILSQYFSNVSYTPVTSPITGKKYDSLPEFPVNGNLIRTLSGVSFFYPGISVTNNGSSSYGDLSLPFYLFEFEEGGAFVFIVLPIDFGDYVLSNYSFRYKGMSPYHVGYNASFNGTSNYQTGYSQGFEAGESVGSTSGYADGYSAGFQAGNTASETGNFLTLFTTIADSQLVLLTGFLDFEFLGFNMLNFFKGLMTVLIAIMVVRLITSGETS